MSKDDFSDEIQQIFMLDEETLSNQSRTETPASEWSSLEKCKAVNPKRVLEEQGLYSAGSGRICNKYIAMSDSDIFRHVFYNYPPLVDPGIEATLFGPEMPIIYSDNGQEYYMELCKEMQQVPIHTFYRNLLSPHIDLSYYGVNPAHVRAMTLALQFNKNVHSLNLTDNFLSYDAAYHLGRLLYTNTTLAKLVLAGCRIGPEGINCLGLGLRVNRTLIQVDLSGNCLDDAGGQIFAKILIGGATVSQINLSRNNFGMKTANALNEALSFITSKITHVNLSWNSFFHQPSIARLIERLAEIQNLQEVNLSWNMLEGEKIATAISNLMRVPYLAVLNLSNNRFRDVEVVEILVSNLWRARKLVTLDLSFNPLSPEEALIVLDKMLKPRVKIQNLLMENIWVDLKFVNCLEQVKKMQSRKDFVITHGEVLHNWLAKGPDPREIVLRRADYVSRADMKHSTDVAMYFLKLNKELGSPINIQDLIDRADADGVQLDEDLLNEIALVFPGPKKGKSKKGSVDLCLVAEYMQRLWPERRLPKTPPPAPEPALELELVPKPI